jgi:poly-gamma-glutamate capsule biosynthesis protein CapA/YwtB (metallophosphatase superfamily)
MAVELLASPPAGGFDLVVGGDVVLRGPAAGRVGPALAAVLRDAVTVVNLEAPLADAPSPAPKSGPHLLAPAAAAAQLRALGVDVAGLANNHLGDHGHAGVRSTLAACAAAGLAVTGAGEDVAAALRPATVAAGGARIAVLAAAEEEFGLAGPGRPGAAPLAGAALPAAIAAARAAHDVVIVLAHGGVEELPVAPPGRAARLRELLAAGADLVVGAHPHTVQGWEEHAGGVAFHSLGDLVFDRDGPGPGVPGALLGVTLRDGAVAGVALLAVRDREGVAELDDAAPLAALAAAIGDTGLWQELAARAFADRHLPFLRGLGAPARPAPSGPPGVRTLRDVGARLGADRAPARPPAPWEALQLLNLVRCESHRETVETAMALAAGVVVDERSERTAALADRLLRDAGYPTAR